VFGSRTGLACAWPAGVSSSVSVAGLPSFSRRTTYESWPASGSDAPCQVSGMPAAAKAWAPEGPTVVGGVGALFVIDEKA